MIIKSDATKAKQFSQNKMGKLFIIITESKFNFECQFPRNYNNSEIQTECPSMINSWVIVEQHN